MDLGDLGTFISTLTSDVTSAFKAFNPTAPIVVAAGSTVATTPSGQTVVASPTTTQATYSGLLLIGGLGIALIVVFMLFSRR